MTLPPTASATVTCAPLLSSRLLISLLEMMTFA
jgi:hypothetical protein